MKIKFNPNKCVGSDTIEIVVVIAVAILIFILGISAGVEEGKKFATRQLIEKGKLAPITYAVNPVATNYDYNEYVK